jgi:hypothetical protein
MDTEDKISGPVGFQPRFDYAEWSSSDLLVRLVLLRHRGRLCVLRLLALEGAQDWRMLFRRASQITDDPNPRVLAALYRIWPHPEPLLYLVWVQLECQHVAMALRERLSVLPVGEALIGTLGAEPPLDAVGKLKQALHVSRMEVYEGFQHEEDADDLHQEAVTHALKRYRGLTGGVQAKQEVTDDELRELCTPPDFGIPDKTASFPKLMDFAAAECRAALERLSPIFDGHVEAAPGQVHQHLRDHFERRQAQKRSGERVPIEEATEGPRGGPNPDVRMDVKDLYEFALKRWGARGERFLKALEAGTMTDAAKAAGVSRPTADKYRKELRRHFS